MENKLKIEMSLMERLAEISSLKLNARLHKEGIELQKMKLGLEIVFINISKAIVIFAVAAQFNLVKEVLIMSLVFATIRKSAFGIHAKNSVVCTISSLMMFVFGSYISYYLKFNNYIVFIIFLVANLLLYKYAPGDTEKHPLLRAKLRKKLKKEAIASGILLMIIALIIPNQVVKTLITLAASFEVISILPLTYRILNRRYKNYEKYEKSVI
ncbi:MAG: accessory gene regulator B family protein [Solirubrobacterales bacterium]